MLGLEGCSGTPGSRDPRAAAAAAVRGVANQRNGNGRYYIMTSKQQETISDLLSKLQGHVYFRPAAGGLADGLKQAALDCANGELAEELAEGEFGLEVSIGSPDGDSELFITFSVDRPGILHSSQIALSQLSDDALEDLAGYLERLMPDAEPADSGTGKHVVRKKPEGDHHEKVAASARLKVTPEWLKSVVPCTDYSYDEIDGKKYIREYYWSKELIERLFKIKSSKTTPEDLQYVAQECCHGDLDWARDLIARLKSPNRPEPVAKEQAQKNQARPAQGQGQGQGRGTAKPVQTVNKPAQSLNKPAQAKEGPSERVRTRSRHRKGFRNQGNEAGRKPDGSTGPKPPQG